MALTEGEQDLRIEQLVRDMNIVKAEQQALRADNAALRLRTLTLEQLLASELPAIKTRLALLEANAVNGLTVALRSGFKDVKAMLLNAEQMTGKILDNTQVTP